MGDLTLKKAFLLIIGVIVFVGVFLLFNLNRGTLPEEQYDLITLSTSRVSPSGRFYAALFESNTGEPYNVSGYKMKVIDQNSQEEYVLDMFFRNRDTNYIVWADEEDIIWAYNGDTGTYFWTFDQDHWEQHGYAGNKMFKVPEALLKLRPNAFK